MSRLTSVMKQPKLLMFAVVATSLFCTAGSVYAAADGGPVGRWPQSWPKEMEPLRKQAWTWDHSAQGLIFEIPFANRKEFESAWPHILKLKRDGVSITLLRRPHIVVETVKTAGVIIQPPRKGHSKGPFSMNRIFLVVDGDIVDLNRIRLPADTQIIDKRFKDGQEK
jgi:hypothetical protein